MPYSFLILLALLFTGCSSRGEKLRAKFDISPPTKILDVPFIAQKEFYCGPASLAMALQHLGINGNPEDLAKMIFTPRKEGSFQNDIVAATRRLGLIAVPITKIKHLLQAINSGAPVMVFQNLGLSWYPKWHYALAVGYQLEDNNLILHSGTVKNSLLNISTFERTWARVNNWGLLIVKPGVIPFMSSEKELIQATSGLELANQMKAAKISYEKILEKWPASLGALVGLGNIHYKMAEYAKSLPFFEEATKLHPQSSGTWYNYAVLLHEVKDTRKAKVAAARAIETADQTTKDIYRKALAELLD